MKNKNKGYITILQIGILISKFSTIIIANNGINKVRTGKNRKYFFTFSLTN